MHVHTVISKDYKPLLKTVPGNLNFAPVPAARASDRHWLYVGVFENGVGVGWLVCRFCNLKGRECVVFCAFILIPSAHFN